MSVSPKAQRCFFRRPPLFALINQQVSEEAGFLSLCLPHHKSYLLSECSDKRKQQHTLYYLLADRSILLVVNSFTMKISSAAFLLGLALSTSESLAGRPIQRKQDAAEEDRALWDRILQDAGMSMPPTGEKRWGSGNSMRSYHSLHATKVYMGNGTLLRFRLFN